MNLSFENSCATSSFANSCSISSFLRGSLVFGFKRGWGWFGISANMLYHCFGISSSGNVIFLVVFMVFIGYCWKLKS